MGVTRSTLFATGQSDREYSINFKIADPKLAECVLLRLLNSENDEFNVGMDVTSINFCPYKPSNRIKTELIEAITSIIG